MHTRSADATIKGYYYQFDSTILQLLGLKNDSDSITIEGIEDIDITTPTDQTTVQCKYLSKPKFNNSTVREPIVLMLDHYLKSTLKNKLKYVLYAHFANELPGTEPHIDLSKLKEILTYSKNRIRKNYALDNKITDSELKGFLKKFKLSFGIEFSAQQKIVLDKLKILYSVSEFEADTHFYNNALRVIFDKAIEKSPTKRKVTKKEFEKSIDCGKILFNLWFIKLRSKEAFLKQTYNNIKSLGGLNPGSNRIILLGEQILKIDNVEMPLNSFIENLINKYYKLNSSLTSAKPITFILDLPQKEMKELKKYLIVKTLVYNDGFEDLSFSSVIFNKNPIINKTKTSKLLESSFMLRLLSMKVYLDNIADIKDSKIVINISQNDTPKKFPSSQVFDIKYCENLKDVYKLLT